MIKPTTPRRIQDTRRYYADIVGKENAPMVQLEENSYQHVLGTGAMLGIIDNFCGHISVGFCRSPVVTLSFDRLDLIQPVFNGDLLRLEGEIIFVGSSSMTIQISGYRFNQNTQLFVPTLNVLVTMVAIDKNGRPISIGQSLDNTNDPYGCTRLRNKVVERKKLAKQWTEMQEKVDQMTHLTAKDVNDEENRSKETHIPMLETVISVQKSFLPRNENINRTIFGGDILKWMENVALYCATNFTKSNDMITISMNRIFFKLPIHVTDVVSMKARVCYVRRYTLEVAVEVFLENILESSNRLKSHTGFFTILSYEKTKKKKRISKGLLLADNDIEGLREYEKAKLRHAFDQETDLFNSPLGLSNL